MPDNEKNSRDPYGRNHRYGRNFGRHARPYGESYGEDTPYPGAYDDWESPDRNRPRRQRPAGFRHSHDDDRGWWERAGDEVLTWFGDDYAERRRRKDFMHRGKGPKNYRRSDERIREEINDRLTDEWNIDASDLEVTVSGGEVILTGYVGDRFQKRRAEDVTEEVRGVTHVENRIRVNSPERNYPIM